MRSMKFIPTSFVMLLPALLCAAGCNVLGDPKPPLQIYDLSAGSDVQLQAGERIAVNVIVDEPDVSRVLDSERILVRLKTNELRYLPQSRWSDRAPRLLQLSLIEAFTRGGRVMGTGAPSSSFRGDYRIEGYLRSFEAVAADRKMQMHVGFDVQLVAEKGARIVSVRSFDAQAQAASENPSDVARAMDTALAALFADIVPWTHAQIEADLRAQPIRQ